MEFGEQVVAKNVRTGEVVSGVVREGMFGVVLGGTQGQEVVREDDVVEVLVYNGGKLAGRGEIRVEIEQLERAVGFVSVEWLPERTELLQNYPNPFNPDTWIPFQLAENTNVTISIYDISGKLIRTLALGGQRAGIYVTKERAAYWNGRNNFAERVSSGVYFYRIDTGKFSAIKRMALLK